MSEYDTTVNYGLKKPWPNADDDVWGTHVNQNMDLLDNLLHVQYLAGPFHGGMPFGQNDINPRINLPRWAAPGAKKVGIIGDSTGTDLPSANYTLDPTQTIWGALKSEITRRNPLNKFMFVNRAISGSNWANPVMTANQRGPTVAVPDWYTDRDKIWLDYIRDDMLDTLFVDLGTNAPQSGMTAGSSVASFINDFFVMINGWVKIPDIIMITNKIANPQATNPLLGSQESYKAMASFLRTFARSNGNGYLANFPKIKYFGLLDLGRHYAARAYGKDFAFQYLQQLPSAIRAGYTLVGPYPGTVTTLGTTTDGDLRLTVVFRNAGGTAMYAALGATGFFLTCSAFLANRIQVTLTSAGIWTAHYQFIGTNTPPTILSSNYSPPAGDVTMTLSLKGEVIQLSLNGTLILDTAVPRLISNYTVQLGATVAPVGSVVFDVTEFCEGIGAQAFQTIDPGTAFGDGGAQAGNDINHPSSSTVALIDYQVIAAANLSAPNPTAQQLKDDKVQIYIDPTSSPNTAITIEEIIKQTSLQSNLLSNVGDALEIEAWGNLGGTTDAKTVRIRWNGLGGASMAAPTAAVATALRWHARATVTKTGPNTQSYGGDGTVSTSGNTGGTSGGVAGVTDTGPITVCVTSQNATNAVAGSITCECFRVSLIKAPGT